MRILNFGSLNVDHVYRLARAVRGGETMGCRSYAKGCGGKGLNQSVALAMAGAEVWHAGLVGEGGAFLRRRLEDSGVDCSLLRDTKLPNGHAIILVDETTGQNSIVLYPGSNHALEVAYIDAALSRFGAGDILLVQNETNRVDELIEKAAARGMDVAFNAAPMDERVLSYPLDKVRWLFVNEVEGAALSGETAPEKIAETLCGRYPNLELILTLGTDGSYYRRGEITLYIPARRVQAVDTTGAGDTFTGYYLSAAAEGADPGYCLTLATAAAALSVTKAGAADSIPTLEEVLKTL